MLVFKNEENIKSKKDKVLEEINLLLHNPNDILGLCGQNRYFLNGLTIPEVKNPGIKKMLKIKKLQLKILKYLDQEKPEKIYQVLETESKKLCSKCEGSIINNDPELKCDKDLLQMIFCDMLRQSIKVIN